LTTLFPLDTGPAVKTTITRSIDTLNPPSDLGGIRLAVPLN
jgi:hypothetical protein